MGKRIGLYSIVFVTHLDATQKTWDKSVIGQYAIVNEVGHMLTNLTTGNTNGWYDTAQLKKIGQIDSVKVAQRILKKCEQMSNLRSEIQDELVKSKVLVEYGIL